MSKYHNNRATIDGITFDSVREANRYASLKLLERAHLITELELQKEFELIPAQFEQVGKKRKCLERKCTYKADFYYFDKEKHCYVCEDVKGVRTKDYIIKRKLMLYVHGIKIVEV